MKETSGQRKFSVVVYLKRNAPAARSVLFLCLSSSEAVQESKAGGGSE